MSAPDETREYFPAAHVVELPKFESAFGPLTPTPHATMADVVATIAFERAA